MHVDWPMFLDVDLNFVVWERIELCLVRAPVEIRAPVVDDALDILSDLLVSFLWEFTRIVSLTQERRSPNPAHLRARSEILRRLAASSTDLASVAGRQSCIL